MATINKRTHKGGKTRWQLRFKDAAGQWRAKDFDSKREAEAFKIDVESASKAGLPTKAASLTVQAAGEIWLEHCRAEGLEAGTLKAYAERLNLHIAPFIGKRKLCELTAPEVEKFRDTLLKTRSRALARLVLASLKSIISEAERRGLATKNVARSTKIARQTRHEEDVIIPTKEEIRTLIAKTAEVLKPGQSYRPLVIIALFTGMRLSELRGLSWDCVDFQKREIRVQQRADFRGVIGSPKSAAGRRTIPVAPIVLNTLREWKLACPKSKLDLVFPARDGRCDEQHSPVLLVPVFESGWNSTTCAMLQRRCSSNKDGRRRRSCR